MDNVPEILKATIKLLNIAWNLVEDPDFEKAIEAIEKDVLDLTALIQAAVDKANLTGDLDN